MCKNKIILKIIKSAVIIQQLPVSHKANVKINDSTVNEKQMHVKKAHRTINWIKMCQL